MGCARMTRKVKNILNLGNKAKFSTIQSISATEETKPTAKFSTHMFLGTTRDYLISVGQRRDSVAEFTLQRGAPLQSCK
ncbi:hypothetical protein A3K79_03080 [Candidatus Bathyarchaeota archaeon RBG_13_46_16b]|nr:MAG: hypothetical protein A3K79_03080 [Candidatus Bathyarchaeota archaeon RBG_13_46_16b]